MSSLPLRRAARLVAASALGAALAASAFPSPASAVSRDYRENGELAFTEKSGTARESYLVWPDGTHGRKADDVNVFGRGTVGGWSEDGSQLFVTDADVWRQHRLLQPWSSSGHTWSNDAYDDDIHSIGRLGQGAFGENGAMFWGSTTGLRRQAGPSPTESLTAKEALDPSFANTDRLVWVSPTEGVMLLDDASDVAAPATPETLVAGPGLQHASIDRGGTRVAYAENDGTSWNIRVVDTTTKVAANLETGTAGSDEQFATMSPDGKQVAFVSNRSGKPAIWVAPVDGSTAARMIPNTERAGTATIDGLSWQPGMHPWHNPTTLVAFDGPQVGKVIRPNYGGQPEGTPGADITYEWFRCSIRRSDKDVCYPTGGTGLEYTMVEADRGFKIKIVRTTTNAVGTTSSSATTDWYLDPPGGRPGIPVLTSPTKAVGGTSAKVEWTAAEPGGWFECSTDWGVTWKECESGMTLTGLKDGYNPFYVAQRNDYGSWGTYLYGSITTDQQKPYQPQIYSYPSPWDETMAGRFEWSGEGKPENTFECQEDNGAWTACTSPHTMTVTNTGAHTFRVRETDGVGLVSDVATRNWTAKQPVAAPAAPTRVSGPAALVKSKTATISFTGADPNGTGFECRVDAGAWASCASPFTTPALSDGLHTADVRQLNAGGAGGELSTTWTVDATAPAAPLYTAKPAGTVASSSAALAFTLEAGATAECQVDGAAWTACASPLELTGLAAGAHKVVVRQTDAAGNVSAGRTAQWSVSAPPSGVAAAPEVAAPQPQVATTTTPAAAAAPRATTTAAAPKLVADLGTSTSGGTAVPTMVVGASSVGVGCAITGTTLTECRVDLYATPATGKAARAAAANPVLVGTGVRKARGTKLTVAVTLNARGRKMLREARSGVKITVRITGTPVSGKAIRTTTTAMLASKRSTVTVGGFATDHATLGRASRRQLVALARDLRGSTVMLRVVGHTDASTSDSDYLKELGARRARTVAAFLRAHGVKAKVALVSRGATAPRATNATQAGRALNRRVELAITR
jgi:outer membrane protein OmpA-like peptidoglycan-associated protein